jgi:hypothetical protein
VFCDEIEYSPSVLVRGREQDRRGELGFRGYPPRDSERPRSQSIVMDV